MSEPTYTQRIYSALGETDLAPCARCNGDVHRRFDHQTHSFVFECRSCGCKTRKVREGATHGQLPPYWLNPAMNPEPKPPKRSWLDVFEKALLFGMGTACLITGAATLLTIIAALCVKP